MSWCALTTDVKTQRQPEPTTVLYEQVAKKIAQLIETGALRAGERIPSVRRASAQHGVSVSTILQAYLALEDRGLIEARPKSGFFVRSVPRRQVPEPHLSRVSRGAGKVEVGGLLSRVFDSARFPEIVPFGAAYPGAELLPVDKLSRVMASVARRARGHGVVYDMPPGCERLRQEIARRALDGGTTLRPDEIITTCGGTEALALGLRAVARQGEVVAVESPTYFGLLQTVEDLGLRAVEIPTHPRTGMDLDALEKILRRSRLAACVSVPNFNNPLGSLMPEENKQRMVEMLARAEVPLIEDDINGDLYFAGERPRVAHAHDRHGGVLLCGSFSKTIAPGYRVGWVAPGRYYERVKALKFTQTLATASLPQLAIAEFLANGGYDHHLRALRAKLSEQVQRIAAEVTEAFPEPIRLSRPGGGLVLWVELPPGVSALELHGRALAEGISIAPGPMFSAQQRFANFVRLNAGHPWNERSAPALRRIGVLVSELMR